MREHHTFWPPQWGFERLVKHGLAEIITNQQQERDERRLEYLRIAIALERIEKLLEPQTVAKFIITQQGDPIMPTQGPLTGLLPGATGTFTAQPVDSTGAVTTVASGVVPVWSSSDSTDVVTAAADGLSATVAVDAAAVAGSTHTLSVALPDGSFNSPVSLPVLAPAVQPVASFVITQS